MSFLNNYFFISVALQAVCKEFLLMKARFSNYEARYQYGLFLGRKQRTEEAKEIFTTIIDEYHHLSPVEKRTTRQWISLAKEALKKMVS